MQELEKFPFSPNPDSAGIVSAGAGRYVTQESFFPRAHGGQDLPVSWRDAGRQNNHNHDVKKELECKRQKRDWEERLNIKKTERERKQYKKPFDPLLG